MRGGGSGGGGGGGSVRGGGAFTTVWRTAPSSCSSQPKASQGEGCSSSSWVDGRSGNGWSADEQPPPTAQGGAAHTHARTDTHTHTHTRAFTPVRPTTTSVEEEEEEEEEEAEECGRNLGATPGTCVKTRVAYDARTPGIASADDANARYNAGFCLFLSPCVRVRLCAHARVCARASVCACTCACACVCACVRACVRP